MTLHQLLTSTALLLINLLAFHTVALALDVNDGSVVERVAYAFPPYEKAAQTTNLAGNASKEEYQRAIQDREFELQKLTYMSDGLKVRAYLYKPVRIAAQKFPVVIFNRGSVVRKDIAPELITLFHRLATAGFVVLAPMYRQSDGGEGRDEVGGADVNDLMNVALLAKSLGFIDLSNMFLYGESRGGMMTYLAIKKHFPANAAAVYGAFTDMEMLIKDRPEVYSPNVLKQIWPDFDSRKEDIVRLRSATYWPESLVIPILIMHGGADWSVNPVQSLTIAQKLQSLGKTYELVIYGGDNHILSSNREDRDRRVVAWFKKHLKSN